MRNLPFLVSSISKCFININDTIKVYENRIDNAKKVTDICPTCHQKLPGVYIPNTAEDEAELARLKSCVADLSNQQQALYEEYKVVKWAEIESNYKNRLHEIKDSLFKLIAKRTDANNLKEKAEYAIKSCEYQLVKVNSEIELHEVTRNNLSDEIKKHEDKIAELEAAGYVEYSSNAIALNAKSVEATRKLEGLFIRKYNPPWNKMINI